MKKTYNDGKYYTLSSFKVMKVPILIADNDLGEKLAKTICEDAYYLSAEGKGQTSIEILRIASNQKGRMIHHLITIRTYDHSERACELRQQALTDGMFASLHHAGYIISEVSFDTYSAFFDRKRYQAMWAINKKVNYSYGIQGTYESPTIIDSVNWKEIYSVLDGSECSICIQIIPTLLSEREKKLILNNTIICQQAAEGLASNTKDAFANLSLMRWKYYAEGLTQPFADVNVIVNGHDSKAALLVARIHQSINESTLSTFSIDNYSDISLYDNPWKISQLIKEKSRVIFSKWSSKEVSVMFDIPCQRDYFIGIEENPFSLSPENSLISEIITVEGSKKLLLGTSIKSNQKIYLNSDAFLLHTAIIGKTGVGKTTFLKNLIQQFSKENIPVLIMEPVKREYRDTAGDEHNKKIFTVERPFWPLLINPFQIPKGVTLGEYRSCLLSAFKAAFSMPDPLPSLFEKAISESYIQYGWTDNSKITDANIRMFDMADFIRIFKRIISRSNYSTEVKGNMMSGGAFRLQSLIERCPRTFDTIISTEVDELLNSTVILEMGNLEPEQKSLVTALTLIRVLAFLKATRRSGSKLQNIMIIDEAHAFLDLGEKSTVEEKSLNNTMSQLLINTITEIRAYGVGIIISDQSPTRIGKCLLDNVDNIISFRLSGEEAKTIKNHIDASDELTKCLPLITVGTFFLKNQNLREPLAVRASKNQVPETYCISDEQIAESYKNYISMNTINNLPFSECTCNSCKNCSISIRDDSRKYAAQIYTERQAKIQSVEVLAQHIIKLPDVLKSSLQEESEQKISVMLCCTAIHLLRICYLEKGISISLSSIAKLISDMTKRISILNGDKDLERE